MPVSCPKGASMRAWPSSMMRPMTGIAARRRPGVPPLKRSSDPALTRPSEPTRKRTIGEAIRTCSSRGVRPSQLQRASTLSAATSGELSEPSRRSFRTRRERSRLTTWKSASAPRSASAAPIKKLAIGMRASHSAPATPAVLNPSAARAVVQPISDRRPGGGSEGGCDAACS